VGMLSFAAKEPGAEVPERKLLRMRYCQEFEVDAIIGQDPLPPDHRSCTCLTNALALEQTFVTKL
jgi:hypothetical protein